NWQLLQQKINGLTSNAQGKVWVADLSSLQDFDNFRQLWVNNIKDIRAKECNGDSMSRILSWDHQKEECWIPTTKISSSDPSSPVEMFIHQWWAVATLRIRHIDVQGN